MATTDSNGILQLEVSDPVVPLQTALNGIGASVSSAMDSTVRTFKVANATARNNLATQRTPSKSDPLRVWRQDTGVFEINDGTGWKSETPAEQDPNLIVIDGTAYQASGTVTTPQLTFLATGALFYAYVDAYLPTPPSGYVLTVSVVATSAAGVWASRSSGNHIILAANTASRSMTLHWQLVKI